MPSTEIAVPESVQTPANPLNEMRMGAQGTALPPACQEKLNALNARFHKSVLKLLKEYGFTAEVEALINHRPL